MPVSRTIIPETDSRRCSYSCSLFSETHLYQEQLSRRLSPERVPIVVLFLLKLTCVKNNFPGDGVQNVFLILFFFFPETHLCQEQLSWRLSPECVSIFALFFLLLKLTCVKNNFPGDGVENIFISLFQLSAREKELMRRH